MLQAERIPPRPVLLRATVCVARVGAVGRQHGGPPQVSRLCNVSPSRPLLGVGRVCAPAPARMARRVPPVRRMRRAHASNVSCAL